MIFTVGQRKIRVKAPVCWEDLLLLPVPETQKYIPASIIVKGKAVSVERILLKSE